MKKSKWNHALFLAGFLTVFFYVSPSLGASDAPDSIHAPAWAFGESLDRGAALWRNGENADSIFNKSKPEQRNKKAAQTKKADAEKNAQSQPGKGKMGFSVKDEGQTWKVAPEQKDLRPDEEMTRDRRHVLRAFADVEAAKDFNISVGPELILRDEQHSEESALMDQPDSELGLGMKFQYAF